MASTYKTDRSRAIDRVRARIRDTGNYDPSVTTLQTITGAVSSDEEIQAAIDANGEAEAAALIAEEHAAFFALEPNSVSQQEGISFSYADRAKALLTIAAAIRAQQSHGRGTNRYGSTSPTITVSNDIQY